MDDGEFRLMFHNIFTGINPHGDFVQRFAGAVVWADEQNFRLLRLVAALIAVKYSLDVEHEETKKRTPGAA